MVVKYRCLQLGDSARISPHKMTRYSFDSDTTHFCLNALYVSSYNSALFFWSLLCILIISVFLVWSSDHLLTVQSSIWNISRLLLFQLAVHNSVNLEIKRVLSHPLCGKRCDQCFSLWPVNKRSVSFSVLLVFASSSLGFFTNYLSRCWPTTYIERRQAAHPLPPE